MAYDGRVLRQATLRFDGSSDPGVLSDCGRPYPSCHLLWSDAMYFSSPWRKIPGVPVSKQAPSIGRGLWHCAICSIFICISRQIMIILLS